MLIRLTTIIIIFITLISNLNIRLTNTVLLFVSGEPLKIISNKSTIVHPRKFLHTKLISPFPNNPSFRPLISCEKLPKKNRLNLQKKKTPTAHTPPYTAIKMVISVPLPRSLLICRRHSATARVRHIYTETPLLKLRDWWCGQPRWRNNNKKKLYKL